MRMKKQVGVLNLLLLMVLGLSGCSSYSSGFACRDAQGVPCTAMEEVYKMIENGEIEQYSAKAKSNSKSKSKYKSQCRGKSCKRRGIRSRSIVDIQELIETESATAK